MGAKNILAELEALGAIGSASVPKEVAKAAQADVVEPAVAANGPDPRGPLMLEQLDKALASLEMLNRGLHGLYEALATIREAWVEPEAEGAEEAAIESSEEPAEEELTIDVDVDEEEPLELISRVSVIIPEPRESFIEAEAAAAEGKGQNAIEDVLIQMKESEGLMIPTMEDDDEALHEESGAE